MLDFTLHGHIVDLWNNDDLKALISFRSSDLFKSCDSLIPKSPPKSQCAVAMQRPSLYCTSLIASQYNSSSPKIR
jgi:hypothetical protein